MPIKRIETRAQLIELQQQRLQLRDDWHEPGERDVTATVSGQRFDNAGFWGSSELALVITGQSFATHRNIEMFVTLYHEDEPVAEINLATLFAFACGTYDG